MTPGLVVSVPHPWHPQEDSCRRPLSLALPPATQLARGCAATGGWSGDIPTRQVNIFLHSSNTQLNLLQDHKLLTIHEGVCSVLRALPAAESTGESSTGGRPVTLE